MSKKIFKQDTNRKATILLLAVMAVIASLIYTKPNPDCLYNKAQPSNTGHLRGLPLSFSIDPLPICEQGYTVGSTVEDFPEITGSIKLAGDVVFWFLAILILDTIVNYGIRKKSR